MPRDRDADRLAQGPGAVFPVSRAAELLPVSDAKARAWLRDQGLTVELCGREVVVWAEVLDALAADPPTPGPGKLRLIHSAPLKPL